MNKIINKLIENKKIKGLKKLLSEIFFTIGLILNMSAGTIFIIIETKIIYTYMQESSVEIILNYLINQFKIGYILIVIGIILEIKDFKEKFQSI